MTLLNDEPDDYPHPKPKHLTSRQRQLMAYIRGQEGLEIRTVEAGYLYRRPTEALQRLELLGLVAREGRGRWIATVE